MKVHGNAALGPAGRLALVEAIESGLTPATAHRWWHRWRGASEQERRLGLWLHDRSSRPRHQPRRLSAAEEEPILRVRGETGLGPGRLAGICRRARSTIWKVLRRHGLSQQRQSARESYHVRGAMLVAGEPTDPWPAQVRDRLAALLDVLSRDLAVTRFFLVEPLAAGGEMAARYRDAMELLAETVRPESDLSDMAVEVRDQALMGGIATLITRRLNAGGIVQLGELLPDLVELTLAPYLGRDEARRFAQSRP